MPRRAVWPRASRLALAAAALALVCVAATSAHRDAHTHRRRHRRWAYTDDDAEETWNGTCATGDRQSPIDLRAADLVVTPMPKLNFVNYAKSGAIRVLNDGHTAKISGFELWGEDRPFIFGGGLDGKYSLVQIHFHWADTDDRGSEHTLTSLHHAAEAHFVHSKEGTNATHVPADAYAVVGVFITVGAKADEPRGSDAFHRLGGALRQIADTGTTIRMQQYSPHNLLPTHRDSFYRYEGSLTTPGCDEVVVWTLLAEPITITRAEMATLRSLKAADSRVHLRTYRDTQPLNGRRVIYRAAKVDEPACAASGLHASIASLLVAAVSAFIARQFELK